MQFLSFFIFMIILSSSAFAGRVRLTGKFNIQSPDPKNPTIQIILSDDIEPIQSKDYVVLKGLKVTPIGEVTRDFYGVVLEDGRRIYDNDLIEIEAADLTVNNGMVYALKPVITKVLEVNLRVACVSQPDAKGRTYFGYFGFWNTKSAAKPDTFMRVDYCDLSGRYGTNCSDTWGTGSFYQAENTVKASLPLKVQTSFDQRTHLNDMREQFMAKYSEQAYWDVYRQREQFQMSLETHVALGDLPVLNSPIGGPNKLLLKAQGLNLLNSTLRWENKRADLEIGGEIKMFCFTWN